MAIFYDYYKNPPQEGEEGDSTLHPRPVVTKTMNSDYLAKQLSNQSKFSEADFRAILYSLASLIVDEISEGRNIHLERIGTFSVSLESRAVTDVKEIRSISIRVKDIHFKPDPSLKQALNMATIQRVKQPRKAISYTEEERLQRILGYIDQHQAINITMVMSMNRCNHKKAKADIQKLMEKGEIRKSWPGGLPLYTR